MVHDRLKAANMGGTPMPQTRRRWRRAFYFVVVAPAAVVLMCALAFWAAVQWWTYPAGISAPPPASTWIEDRQGEPLAAFASSNGDWQLPLTQRQISPHLLDAIVAVEDSRFYQHGGVDWRSVGGAVRDDIARRSVRRGASTITMQLQRLREPAPRSLPEKIEQAIRATQIEQSQSKSRDSRRISESRSFRRESRGRGGGKLEIFRQAMPGIEPCRGGAPGGIAAESESAAAGSASGGGPGTARSRAGSDARLWNDHRRAAQPGGWRADRRTVAGASARDRWRGRAASR